MDNKVIYVNASNCHQGGGKTLLNGFIKGLEKSTQKVVIYIDVRYKYEAVINSNIELLRVSKFSRFFVRYKIGKRLKLGDEVIYFGNLPPILKFRCNKVSLLLSSRFYVDMISFKGFKLSDRIKICLERLYYNATLNNVTEVIVQTSTMKKLLKKSGYEGKVFVWAFDSIGNLNDDIKSGWGVKEKDSFIYVASLLPYKNHHRLLETWRNLKESGLTPRLYLTIDQNNNLKKWISAFVEENDLNIILLEKLQRNELIDYYRRCEVLIYPSYFEAYGLPLIEAKKYKLKILTSDVDYSWDFIIPDGVFNPFDVESITRSVKRYLGVETQLDEIYSPEEFIHKLNIK